MSDIKPSEISSILQMQLQNLNNEVHFEEIGKVLQVSDGVARVYGLEKVQSNELVQFENGTMGVVLNLKKTTSVSCFWPYRRHQGRRNRKAHTAHCISHGWRWHVGPCSRRIR